MIHSETSLETFIDSAPHGLARIGPPAVVLYEFGNFSVTHPYSKKDPESVAFFKRYSAQRKQATTMKHVAARDVLRTAIEAPIMYYDHDGSWYLELFHGIRPALGLGVQPIDEFLSELFSAATNPSWGNLYEVGCIVENHEGKFSTATISIPWQSTAPFYNRFNPEDPFIWTDPTIAGMSLFDQKIGQKPDPRYLETPLEHSKRAQIRAALEPHEIWWGAALARRGEFLEKRPPPELQFVTRVLNQLSTDLPPLNTAKEVRGYFVTAEEKDFLSLKSLEPHIFLSDRNWLAK